MPYDGGAEREARGDCKGTGVDFQIVSNFVEFPASLVTARGVCAGEVWSIFCRMAPYMYSHNSAATGQPVLTARLSSHPTFISVLTRQAAAHLSLLSWLHSFSFLQNAS